MDHTSDHLVNPDYLVAGMTRDRSCGQFRMDSFPDQLEQSFNAL